MRISDWSSDVCSSDLLYGNLAERGCIVKTAGVDKSILKFTGTAVVLESQDAAVEAILGGKVKAGDVVVIRYEGPRGGPGSAIQRLSAGASRMASEIGRAHV